MASMEHPARSFQLVWLLASCVCSASAWAQAAASGAPPVVWLSSYFPPVNIPLEGQPGNGIADKITAYVVGQWPEARHQFVQANPTRTWHMLEQGQPMCDTAALRTPEREKRAYFRDVFYAPPPQLVIRPEALEQVRLNEQGQVDPTELMNNPDLRGLIVKRRAYGPAVDKVLQQVGGRLNVEQLTTPNYGIGTLKMVLLGRADYLIEYDFTLAYAITQQAELARLKVLPLKGADSFVVTGFACPRTPWGLATIRKIDAILSTPAAATLIINTELAALTSATAARYGTLIRESVRRASSVDPERIR